MNQHIKFLALLIHFNHANDQQTINKYGRQTTSYYHS